MPTYYFWSILIGARSKDITAMAYWKSFDVTEECEESKFLKLKMPAFKPGWIRHGYFELTMPEDIKFYQRVIVMKKVSFAIILFINYRMSLHAIMPFAIMHLHAHLTY